MQFPLLCLQTERLRMVLGWKMKPGERVLIMDDAIIFTRGVKMKIFEEKGVRSPPTSKIHLCIVICIQLVNRSLVSGCTEEDCVLTLDIEKIGKDAEKNS